MEKHAYLILAHKCDYTLQSLISMLDHPMNDIFLHMDIKCKQYNENIMPKCVYSGFTLVDRTNVSWGGYSQINAELVLLKAAVNKEKYLYYHLLSGEDLQIKTNEYIQNFFKENNGKEFIRFQSEDFKYWERVRYYYFFQEKAGRNLNIWRLIDKFLVCFQRMIRINRHRGIAFQKGTNWFSITDKLARYIISREEWIKYTFAYTRACDEIFIQTLVNCNDEFKRNLYHLQYDNDSHAIMRKIDWERGNPYTFTVADYQELMESEMLWARKFNCIIDQEIIDLIKERLGVSLPEN